VLQDVKEATSKDEDYQEAIKSLKKIEKNLNNTHNQEERFMYHCVRFWITCDLRTSIAKSRYIAKIVAHIWYHKMKERM
jgi:ABC-type Fe3+-citrate transport system substrate-binding protein